MEEGGHQLGSRGAQGVAEGDGAAVDVEAGGGGADFLQPSEGDGGEGLVDFVEVDVLDAHAGATQGAAGGGDDFLEHDHRVAAGDGEVDDAGQWGEAVFLQRPLRDDDDARGAVADLA